MSTIKPSFEEVWNRILHAQGQTFHTKTRLPFTYEIRGDYFCPSRTDQEIPQSVLRKAYKLAPIKKPSDISRTIWGYSYIWAVLHDHAISKGDW